ncbi:MULTISPECIES: phage holin family protein [unclassified Luteococcus]|uniref:phage holin family protein n=1 Tax=unclassified Luteococcus TaxID=2639923 RepID=UPI00313C75ED
MFARLLANAAALALATVLVPGITLQGGSLTQRAVVIVIVAVIFGVLNALVKPVLKVLSLPLVILTLGLFLWVLNAGMLMLTSWVAGQLGQPWRVTGWLAALLGSVVISVVSAVVGGLLKGEDR